MELPGREYGSNRHLFWLISFNISVALGRLVSECPFTANGELEKGPDFEKSGEGVVRFWFAGAAVAG